MSIIKLGGINEITEAVLPPEDAYFLLCTKVDEHKTEKGLSYRLIFECEDVGDENYASLFDYMSIPGEGDDKEKIEFKLLLIKRRLMALGLGDALADESFDPAEMVGARTSDKVPVTISPPTPENGEREGRNIIWPQCPTEE